MQGPVDEEQAQLVLRRPAHIARLAAMPLGLRDGSLDREDDVTEVDRLAWRQGEGDVSRGRRCDTAS